MKKKKLNRDLWGFHLFPYYQMRIDCDEFHGMACLIKMLDGNSQYWEDADAGRLQVCGSGMSWMQLVPDGQKRVITVKYFPYGEHDAERKIYPKPADERYQPSVWYVDVIEGIEYDSEGIVVYIDKYLDVIFIPEGKVSISDRDELDGAYESGELTKEQYEEALKEGDDIVRQLCGDISKTDAWCAKVRDIMEKRIAEGEPPMFLYHGSQYDLEVLEPQKACGQTDAESQCSIYAAKSAKEVIPFALPIRWYPDTPEGKRNFECSFGTTKLNYGSLDPEGKGYVYRLKSDGFKRVDDFQWVCDKSVNYLEKMEIKVKDFLHTVEFSEDAKRIMKEMYGKEV